MILNKIKFKSGLYHSIKFGKKRSIQLIVVQIIYKQGGIEIEKL